MQTIDAIERKFLKTNIPAFDIGDTVDVHVKIKEGEKERIQIFTGTVISKRGHGMTSSFAVRRIVQGEGVERTFPLHSPTVVDVRVRKKGQVRRAKLFYLRGRRGKATRIREKLHESGTLPATGPATAPAATPAPAPQEKK
ncbi:MAG: 50S ribosomal protein L19 [Planctomycetota bacterium]|nr:50S ribosomal protein L19 [Planctomycetota bacterium]